MDSLPVGARLTLEAEKARIAERAKSLDLLMQQEDANRRAREWRSDYQSRARARRVRSRRRKTLAKRLKR